MKLVLWGGAMLLVTAQMAWADEDCGDKSSQTEMNICAGEAYKKSDAELNKVYKQLQARLKADVAKAKLLTNAQRAWIGYRDAECKFNGAGAEGGSLYPFLINSCLTDTTNGRIKDLKGYLTCDEGDTACSAPAAK